jgi:acetyl coenzyme A synthetase (ADP forming)-like protein
MRVLAPVAPTADLSLSGHVLLRDGSAIALRLASPEDVTAAGEFFHAMPTLDRYQRFLAPGEPASAELAQLCDSRDPTTRATIIAERLVARGPKIVAVVSYARTTPEQAQVDFAVDATLQGRGVATAMLERLAALAANSGIRTLRAVTLSENHAMIDVFLNSGFPVEVAPHPGGADVTLTLSLTQAGADAIDHRAQSADAQSIGRLLRPRSVAVIGASRTSSHLGRRVLEALTDAGFEGPIYPVNPSAADLDGRRCYPSAAAIPGGVDLAIIAVPPDHVLAAVDDCGAAGIKSLVVITAGFSETGESGRALQGALAQKIRAYGMRMLGPNCMGLLNTSIRLNASFSPVVPPSGPIALSSQSGALGLTVLELARARGLGLSTFVSIGNKADISSNDLLQYWETDADTSVILLYLESFGNPRRFGQLARRIGSHKPIVAVKAGRTRAGRRAASSHTAALAADDAIVDELFRSTGVVRAETIDEMFDVASVLASQQLPRGRRVAIVTNGGGPGILAVDACERSGLAVVELSEATRTRLARFLSTSASLGNPVDMVASAGAEEFRQSIETMLNADEVDALIVIYTPIDLQHAAEVNDAIRRGIANGREAGFRKPVLACMMAGRAEPRPLEIGAERVPAFRFPENAARALSKAADYAEWRAADPGRVWRFDDVRTAEAQALISSVIEARGDTWLTPDEIQRLLSAYHLPLAYGRLIKTADDAVAVATTIGGAVAAKISASDLLHKSDIGGVRTDLRTPDEVRSAVAELLNVAQIRNLHLDGILIQPMASGVETMIGLTQDPLFGAVVGFGMGGTDVELARDVHFRPAPLSDRDAEDLIRESRAFPQLNGYRGRPAADVPALSDLLLHVSQLAVEHPQVLETDLNPVMVRPAGQGCTVVDARVRVGARHHVV